MLPPIGGPCTLISLRVVRSGLFTLDELAASGTVAPVMAPVLRALAAA
ncbi:MAG TPA: hypothetical protein VGK53_14825 [Propionicimonas sp.]|jgi:pilus assembly protein CpaF